MALTKKQKLVFDFICEYRIEHGFSPTQAEIKEHFGFRSLGSVQDYIRYLVQGGYLRNDPNAVRGLEPANVDDDGNSPIQKSKLSVINGSADEHVSIPLLGKVAAGAPIEAVEGNDLISVPSQLIGRGKHYALKVTGQSMIEDGILDGDIIILRHQENAHNGETVVAVIENEATVKRFYKKGQSVELVPANSAMQPIVVDANRCEVKGVLVGLFRKY